MQLLVNYPCVTCGCSTQAEGSPFLSFLKGETISSISCVDKHNMDNRSITWLKSDRESRFTRCENTTFAYRKLNAVSNASRDQQINMFVNENLPRFVSILLGVLLDFQSGITFPLFPSKFITNSQWCPIWTNFVCENIGTDSNCIRKDI